MSKYKGAIADFPEEVVEKMLEYQEKQGNLRDVSVFEKYPCSASPLGFDWDKTDKTVEGLDFWFDVIICKKFDLFFSRYPKKKEPIVGVFKVDDTVYSWRYGNIPGTVIEADYSNYKYPLLVEFSDGFGFKRRLKYHIDGSMGDDKPELSFVPYDLVNGGFSQERPLPNLKKGDLIWVKHDKGEWLYKRFIDWEKRNSRTVIVSSQDSPSSFGIYNEWSIECPIK